MSMYAEGELLETFWHARGIALAAVNCVFGALTTIDSFRGLCKATQPRWFWIYVGCTGFAFLICCVWSTHFVGMSALSLGTDDLCDDTGRMVLIHYEVYMTVVTCVLSSMIASGAFACLAWRDLGQEVAPSRMRTVICGLIIAFAVTLMHFSGMIAQHGNFFMEWDWRWVGSSMGLPVVLAPVALALLLVRIPRAMLSTAHGFLFFAARNLALVVVLVIAVFTVHFSGMLAVRFRYTSSDQAPELGLTRWSANYTTISDYTNTVVVAFLGLLGRFVDSLHEFYGQPRMDQEEEIKMGAKESERSLYRVVGATPDQGELASHVSPREAVASHSQPASPRYASPSYASP